MYNSLPIYSSLQLISKVRLEREETAGQAQMERKRRELLKIRLDSCALIRRSTILQRIRQKERIVAQKQLLEKQKKLKEFTNRVYNDIYYCVGYCMLYMFNGV